MLSFVLKVVKHCVFLRDSGSEFQTVGPKTGKDLLPKVSRETQGTVINNLCSYSIVKLHRVLAAQTFVMVDYVKGDDGKEALYKYGEYGSFEHLLFLFCGSFCV